MGEVVKLMGKNKVLVKVHPEGKYVVELEKNIDVSKLTVNTRVALRNDSYALHKTLPSKVDPLVSLMNDEDWRPTSVQKRCAKYKTISAISDCEDFSCEPL